MTRFIVAGMPQGKARPRFNSATRAAYTPAATKAYENLTAWAYKTAGGKYAAPGVLICLSVVAYYPIPVSASKQLRQQMESGRIVPHRKPDLDNICKSILDGLQGVAYNDDAQLVALTAQKLYTAATPCVEVRVWQYGEEV